MKKHILLLQICLLAAAPLACIAQTTADDHALISQLITYRFGGDTKGVEAIAQRVSEARLNPESRRIVARELADVLRKTKSFDARQFACRQLVFVGSAEQAPLLASLLTDEDLAHYALMPLARIPGKAVNDAMVAALPRLHGITKVAVLDTLANRGDLRAVSPLIGMLDELSPTVSDGAAAALAKLPDPRGRAALCQAYAAVSHFSIKSGGGSTRDRAIAMRLAARYEQARRLAVGHALLNCAGRCAARGDLRDAAPVYSLLSEASIAPILRAAALRGQVRVSPGSAAALIIRALSEDRTPRQKMAAELAREIPGAALTRQLSAALPALPAHGRLLLLEALGDRGDAAAAPAVTAQCKSANASVRTGALLALGKLGGPGSVPLLLAVAAGGNPEDGKAAQDSLIALRGPGVDNALVGVLSGGEPAIKVEAIRALGMRGAAVSSSQIVTEAKDSNLQVREAAFKVLRDLGQPALLPELVDLMLSTPPEARDEAVEAVTEIARRSPVASRTEIFSSRYAAATKSADRITIINILGQLGDPAGLPTIRTGLADSDNDIRTAAISVLGDWSNDEPMADLLNVVNTSTDARQRAIALRGYLRMIVGNDQRAPEEAMRLLREVAPKATLAGDKRILLAGAAGIRSLDALQFVAGYLSDAEVSAEAENAVMGIAQSTIGAYPDKTRAALASIAASGVNDELRKKAASILATQAKFGDFIVAWEVSPVYLRDGANYSALFDIPFPPEDPAESAKVPWRLMPAGTSPDQPWLLDLLAAIGGEQRVAYLRTAIHSDKDRDLILELGSDDGVKVWWNEQKVFGNNVARGVSPAEEKVPVRARAGWNSLLLKITQNNLGWGACARATNPDGSPATGLQFAVPSSLPAH